MYRGDKYTRGKTSSKRYTASCINLIIDCPESFSVLLLYSSLQKKKTLKNICPTVAAK